MSAADSLTYSAARNEIRAILKRIPTQNLPKFRDKEGCIWFNDLSMGFISASHPEKLSDSYISTLLAAESAGRELRRRAQVTS